MGPLCSQNVHCIDVDSTFTDRQNLCAPQFVCEITTWRHTNSTDRTFVRDTRSSMRQKQTLYNWIELLCCSVFGHEIAIARQIEPLPIVRSIITNPFSIVNENAERKGAIYLHGTFVLCNVHHKQANASTNTQSQNNSLRAQRCYCDGTFVHIQKLPWSRQLLFSNVNNLLSVHKLENITSPSCRGHRDLSNGIKKPKTGSRIRQNLCALYPRYIVNMQRCNYHETRWWLSRINE